MTESLLGAIVGAAIAVLGGFFATLYIQKREVDREARSIRDELIASLRLVRYELSWNASVAKSLLSPSGEILPLEMRDASYRSVQLILIRHLPQELREGLAKAYETMPIAMSNLAAFQRRGGGTSDEVAAVTRIGALMSDSNRALGSHLTDVLKVEL